LKVEIFGIHRGQIALQESQKNGRSSFSNNRESIFICLNGKGKRKEKGNKTNDAINMLKL